VVCGFAGIWCGCWGLGGRVVEGWWRGGKRWMEELMESGLGPTKHWEDIYERLGKSTTSCHSCTASNLGICSYSASIPIHFI
jgi:hypothetical protein